MWNAVQASFKGSASSQAKTVAGGVRVRPAPRRTSGRKDRPDLVNSARTEFDAHTAASINRATRRLKQGTGGRFGQCVEVGLGTRSALNTADLLASVVREGPGARAPEIRRILAVVKHPMSIAHAIATSETGQRGFEAVVQLIADGRLRIRDGWSILPGKTIEPVPAEVSP